MFAGGYPLFPGNRGCAGIVTSEMDGYGAS